MSGVSGDSAAAAGARQRRQRKTKVFADELVGSSAVSSAAAGSEDATEAPIEEAIDEAKTIDIGNYGLEIDKILAWRWKDGAHIVHHTTDGTIVTGDQTNNIAPFEGKQTQEEETTNTDTQAQTEASPTPMAIDPPSLPASSPTPTSTAASSPSQSQPQPPIKSTPPTAAADVPPSTSSSTSSGRKKKAPAFLDDSEVDPPIGSRKKKSAAPKDPTLNAKGQPKRAYKRKADSAPKESEAGVAAAAASSSDPASTSLAIPAPMLGRRRKNFTPVTSSEAMAAFQRSLLAAREASGITDAPTGAFAPKRPGRVNRDADDSSSDDEQSIAAGEDADQIDAEAESDGEDGSDDGDDSDSASSDGDDDERPTKRRRVNSSKKKSVSEPKKKPKRTAKEKKAQKVAKSNRPSSTAIRNGLIQEHGGKEFFVTFKGRSYLHAKWVDVYAFLQPPKSRQEEVEENDKTSGTFTQLRIKLQRFARATPLPIGDDEELFLSDFVEIDRIVARKTQIDEPDSDDSNSKKKRASPKKSTYYLIKWQGLPYSASTWEHSRYVRDDTKIHEFEARQKNPLKLTSPEARLQQLGASNTKPRPQPEEFAAARMTPEHMPTFKNGNELRPWQCGGVNWLNSNWYQRKGCILADEMGLGKTVMTVTHMLHIRHAYTRGPFLVVVPLSTLPHWKREFDTWSDLNSVVFQGSKEDREFVKTYEWNYFMNESGEYDGQITGMNIEYKFDVLLCTYESILSETTFLSRVPWKIVAVDEAHRLKNASSRLFKALKLFSFEHRLLMTGTPIQNNLTELWTLLNFIEPERFGSMEEFQSHYGVLEKNEQVKQLQASLSPYLLRRMKEDVAKNIPAKEETIVQVELTILQKQYYRAIYERNRTFLYKGCSGGNVPNLLNIVMQLRKVCSHPFLLPGVEDKETEGLHTNEEFLKSLVAASGKLVLIDKLLPKLQATGHRVLIFSQMKMVLDLLEMYMKLKGYIYERIDGSIRGNERQAAIDRFCRPDSDRFIFMLSTRAGGQGINLTAADVVIIYDSDWNPQNDSQAQARCHRIGQCWGPGTMLMQIDGRPKKVEELTIGDQLMGDDGTPRTVQKLFYSHTRDDALYAPHEPQAHTMYRITPSTPGMVSWTCNSAHVLVLRWNQPPSAVRCTHAAGVSRSYEFGVFERRGDSVVRAYRQFADHSSALAAHALATAKFVPLEAELTVAGFISCDEEVREAACMFQTSVPLHFHQTHASLTHRLEQYLGAPINRALLMETAWVLGLYATSGCDGTIALPNDDESAPIRHKLQGWINTVSPIINSTIHTAADDSIPFDGAMLHVCGGDLLRHLVSSYEFDRMGGGVLPRALLQESIDIRRAFASGIIDTRGELNDSNSFITFSHDMGVDLDTLTHLMRGLGCGVRTMQADATSQCKAAIGVNYCANLASIEPVLVHRRLRAGGVDVRCDSSAHSCFSFHIDSASPGAYHGVELDGNQRCLLDDFTVTHNSKLVKIYRLVTRGTYETDMFRRASMKLGLDQAVLKKAGLDSTSGDGPGNDTNALSSLDKTEIESLLRNGAYALLDDPASEAASKHFSEASIESILADRTTVIKTGGNDENAGPREASTFSQAVFASSESDSQLDVLDKQFWEKLLPDERSAQRLTEKLFSGAAYATPAARAEFMHHLEGHVEEIVKEYQQGNSLEHVPIIVDILKTIANATEDAPTTEALTNTTTTPMDTSDGAAPSVSSDAAAVGVSSAPVHMGWSRDQIRQCSEWCSELLKPRRQRKVAERYTDLSLNGPQVPPQPGASQAIESAFKRRLYNKILNGMGGIVFTRKQRRSLTQSLLDLAGVLPFPRSVLAAHSGSSAIPSDDGRSTPAMEATPPTTDEKLQVWYTLRASLESSLQERRLSELIAWSLSFFNLLISLSDAQDVPIFTAALDRFRACVPSQTELDRVEAAESKDRRKRERHNAIRKLLAEQLRQKIAQAKRDATRDAAAATSASDATSDALVKVEPASAPTPTPLPSSSSPTPAPSDDDLKLEAATLETAVGTIKVDELLAEEGVGQTFSSSGKRIGRPQTVGLSSDTATLIQMQPHLVRGSSVEQITVESLRDDYNDAQEQFEAREELDHYARFHRDCLKASIAHFPSLSEDLPFVKYLAKRCKRWARFMLLATQLKLELNEFESLLESESKEREYILSVAKQYLPSGALDEPTDMKQEEEEAAFIEGTINIAEDKNAPAQTQTQTTTPNTNPASEATSASMDTDAGVDATSDSSSLSSGSIFAPHRRILANLGKASLSDLKSVPYPILARLLRRCVTRSPGRSADIKAHGPILAQVRFPANLDRCPIWWWSPRDDFDYCAGIARHGVGFERIAADPKLGFRAKLAEFVFEEEREREAPGDESHDEEDEKPHSASPSKRKAKVKQADTTAAAASSSSSGAVKDDDEPVSGPSGSLNAAGTGCVCSSSRWSRGSGRTKVCTSCSYWYHLNCCEDTSKLRLDQFLPLPPSHPLAQGLAPITNDEEYAPTNTTTIKAEPNDETMAQANADDATMDVDVATTVKDEGDDSDTQSEGETTARPRRVKSSSTVAASAPSASPLSLSLDHGWRCPRCSLTWPVMRALELRMRVIVDHLARVRRQRARAREKLLRILDEANFHATLSTAASTSAQKPRASTPSPAADSAPTPWTRKERGEFGRTLNAWGTAFFIRGGYHTGVPVLEALIQSSGGKSLAAAALTANPILNRKTSTHLQQYYDRLINQCNYLMDKGRRDTAVTFVKRRTARLAIEHRELSEARRMIDELIDRSATRNARYCFCRGRAAEARLAAAKKSRRRQPEEFLIGCDDGSSSECQLAGGWYHGLCLNVAAASDEKWVCPFCTAKANGQEPILPEGADYTPPGPDDIPPQPKAPVTPLLPLPSAYRPAELHGWETDGQVNVDVSDHGGDSDADGGNGGSNLSSALTLAELETEYNTRVDHYIRECRTADDEYAALAAVNPTPLVKPNMIDEGITPQIAFKLVARLRMLQQMRDGLAKGEEAALALLHSLAQQKPNASAANSLLHKMPEWWWPPLHDWAILRAVFKHGIGNVDDILHDPLFLPAWKPEPANDYPALTALLIQSSGAKQSMHKQMEQFLTTFLQDRTPLLKRLTLLSTWLQYGAAANPNPLDDFLPLHSKSDPNSPPNPVNAALSQFVGSNGRRLESKAEKSTRHRVPLVKILSAKLARGDASSSEDEEEEEEDATRITAPVTHTHKQPRKKMKKTTHAYVDDSTEPAHDAGDIGEDGKRKRSVSKRKLDAEADAIAIDRIRKERRAPSNTRASEEAETHSPGRPAKRKYQRRSKAADEPGPSSADTPGDVPAAGDDAPDRIASDDEPPAAKQPKAAIIHSEHEVPRDAKGNVKEFTIKSGIRIVALGKINGHLAYHKGNTLFPVGFHSIRPYYSVRFPSTRTEYTNQILDGGDSGPIFTVTAADDPGTVYSGPSASACWSTIVKSVNHARGKADARAAVSGLEHFGISHAVVRALVNKMPGAREILARINTAEPNAQVTPAAAGTAAGTSPTPAPPAAQSPPSSTPVKAAAAAAVAAAAAAANAASSAHASVRLVPSAARPMMGAGPAVFSPGSSAPSPAITQPTYYAPNAQVPVPVNAVMQQGLPHNVMHNVTFAQQQQQQQQLMQQQLSMMMTPEQLMFAQQQYRYNVMQHQHQQQQQHHAGNVPVPAMAMAPGSVGPMAAHSLAAVNAVPLAAHTVPAMIIPTHMQTQTNAIATPPTTTTPMQALLHPATLTTPATNDQPEPTPPAPMEM